MEIIIGHTTKQDPTVMGMGMKMKDIHRADFIVGLNAGQYHILKSRRPLILKTNTKIKALTDLYVISYTLPRKKKKEMKKYIDRVITKFKSDI
jgi:hypothetical protein